MADWKQAQLTQWNQNNSEYSDEEEYSDDDDYAPIEATAWGSQTVGNDGATNVSLTVSGWEALIDPNIKIKENGVGSGQLHRKGNNYIPIDEEAIINRRLGKPVPKGGLSSNKKKSRGRKSKPSSGASTPRKSSTLVPPSSSAYRSREMIATGPWATSELASTPFWTQPQSAVNGTNASKYATSTPAVPAAPVVPAVPAAPTVLNPPPVSQPAPKPALSSAFTQGTFASKYASPPPVQNTSSAQPAQSTQPVQQPTNPFQQPTPSNATEQNTVFPRLDAPVLNFNIELTPGVNAKFAVYINDDPLEVVNKFEKNHHLEMSAIAKQRFAQHLQNCLAPYRK
ncbi:uncharacterized protein BX663DRAFT_516735 [Cokeromyces recurvatus]|uniref:uncharacterized protein n=1 Tax=Cokeromyces recurvatus TaxID=90255 RepID=UPI00221F187B|nr:uncharacterized protein BX663DRAFT_516735 [Cokeromyces recurvatus]KAI7900855.1 hypothetical protein BX663DRAFT_516735 [Cokeromyces recurvatus]